MIEDFEFFENIVSVTHIGPRNRSTTKTGLIRKLLSDKVLTAQEVCKASGYNTKGVHSALKRMVKNKEVVTFDTTKDSSKYYTSVDNAKRLKIV